MGFLSGAPYFLAPVNALNFLTFAMKRWVQDFSWCRRIIVDKQVVIQKDQIHLSIASIAIDDHDDDATTGTESSEAFEVD